MKSKIRLVLVIVFTVLTFNLSFANQQQKNLPSDNGNGAMNLQCLATNCDQLSVDECIKKCTPQQD